MPTLNAMPQWSQVQNNYLIEKDFVKTIKSSIDLKHWKRTSKFQLIEAVIDVGNIEKIDYPNKTQQQCRTVDFIEQGSL